MAADSALGAAQQEANAAAAALGLARRALEAELNVLASTSVAQLQCVMRASLPAGAWQQADHGSAASLLALPWAEGVLNTLAGLGTLQLFCDRFQVSRLLADWSAHMYRYVP